MNNLKYYVLSGVCFLFLLFGGIIGCPYYNVWQQEMSGKAEFAKAEQNRKIKIENGAITPTYIQYLWVRQQNLSGKNTKIIYIPTETGLPLLEAGRAK